MCILVVSYFIYSSVFLGYNVYRHQEILTMKILVVGFPKYADQAVNTSELLLPRLKRDGIVTALLPVEYDKAISVFNEAIDKEKPEAVLILALSPFVQRPTLETYAYNQMNSVQPDEAGIVRQNETIHEDGLPSYQGSHDLFSLQQYVLSQGEKVDIAIDPGRFVANAVYYEALYKKNSAVLLHVPSEKNYALDDTLETVNRILDYLDY